MRKRSLSFLFFAFLTLIPTLALADGGGAADVMADGLLWAFLSAFGWGVLTSLTPCVYPMITILIAVFGARDEDVSRGRAMILATAFVLGIATLYTGLGVLFSAVLGGSSNELLSNAYVMIPICLVLLALAASMFGAFEIRLPYALQQKLNTVGGKGYTGAYLLGLVLGIVAAPCTGAFAAGILLFAANQSVPVGAALMFTYSMGMGLLFWVIAVFAMTMPKSGAWMEGVKSVCGIVLMAMVFYFLRPIFPALQEFTSPSPTFLSVSLALAVAGIVVGGIHLSFHGGTAVRLRKGLGVVLAIVGLCGTLNWYLTPDQEIEWRHNETEAYAEATASGKHVMIDFGADWCLPCKEIEKIVGDDDLYGDITRSFVPLKIDVSKQDAEDERLQKKYSAPILPAVIFMDAQGNELGRYTDKDPDADAFRATLNKIVTEHPPGR